MAFQCRWLRLPRSFRRAYLSCPCQQRDCGYPATISVGGAGDGLSDADAGITPPVCIRASLSCRRMRTWLRCDEYGNG